MTTTILDNSANEFAAFSTILSGFDEEYVSPNRKSKSFSLSPTAKKNVAESFSSRLRQPGEDEEEEKEEDTITTTRTNLWMSSAK